MARLRSEKRTLEEKFEALETETKEIKKRLLEKDALEEENKALKKEVDYLKAIIDNEGIVIEEVEEEVDAMDK